MLAALVAALENPEIDAALASAISGLINYLRSLPEKDLEKVEAAVMAQMKSAHAQSDSADQFHVDTKARLDEIAKAQDGVTKMVNALHSQIAARIGA
jgi:hypothetical protein